MYVLRQQNKVSPFRKDTKALSDIQYITLTFNLFITIQN